MKQNRLSLSWSTFCLAVYLLVFVSIGNLQAAPLNVSVQTLGELAIYPELRAPASVMSLTQSRISAEVTARIIEIPVQTGDIVDKGAVLARLERRDYQLALESAQVATEVLAARQELADYELQRARSLSAKKVVSEQLLKQREAEVNTLRAEQKNLQIAIRQAQRKLDKTILHAPFNAIIKDKPGQVGELATPGTPLLQIVNAESREVSARIQVRLINSLQKASRLELDTGATRYPLTLRTLIPLVDNRAQTLEARLTFSGKSALGGEAGELVWQNPQAHIPAELLIRRAGKLGVFIATDNRARFLALSEAQEGRPALTSLGPDTHLVTQGRFQLQNGDEIVWAE